MFLLTQIAERLSWRMQGLAWRVRQDAPLPTASGMRGARLSSSSRAHMQNVRKTMPTLTHAALRAAKRSAAAGVIAGSCLSALTVGALAANHALLASVVDEARLRDAIDKRLQRLVVDRDQRPLGAAGPSLDAPSASSPVAAACIDLVLWQEDRHHASVWRRYAGVDLPALGLAALGQRGAGTLAMQIPRVALDLRPGHSTFERKRIELAAAAVVTRIYGGNMRNVARDYLLMAPFGVALNGGGGEIAGLVSFAAAAFGKPASALTPSECAIAVASLPMPPWFNDDGARSRKRHDLVAARAGALLRSAGLSSPEAVASIEGWRTTFPIRGAETLPVIARRELAPLLPLLFAEGQP